MKKLLCVVTAICMVLSFAGCSLFRFVSMEVEDMLKLPDDEMISTLLMQLGAEDFDSLNESQKVVYTAAAFEMEVLNGGVVQFLSNEAKSAAPYVCQALEKLGAEEHLSILQQMLEQNKVDLNDLSAFVTDDLEVFSKLYDQYDFEAFDSAYEDLPSMPDLIRSYIQSHMDEF